MSGGTTPVINSTLAGILKVLKKRKNEVFAGSPGLEGFLKNKVVNLSKLSLSKINIIRKTPGSHFIGTSRLTKLNDSQIDRFRSILIEKKISNIINIGGNGTLRQSMYKSHQNKLAQIHLKEKESFENIIHDVK